MAEKKKTPKLNSPRRIRKGEPSYGKKKFVVFVKKPNGNVVKVTFEVDGTANECDPFVLVPHEAL